MLNAFFKAIGQLNDAAIRRPLWLGAGVALAVFIGLWFAIGWALANTTLFSYGWLEAAIDLLGGLAVIGMTWFLFPGVVSGVAGFFMDGVADAVEARHYPGLPPAEGLSAGAGALSAIKFLSVMVLLNLGLLVFLFLPPVFPFVFYSVNGYLLGREYFELVAFRRVSPEAARALRGAHRIRVFFSGVVTALLLTVPVVNLLAPVIATAAMVHLFHGWWDKEGRVSGP